MSNLKKINKFNSGGKHKENPLGGIPFMKGALAEEGETSMRFDDGDYIFTNKLFVDDVEFDIPIKLPRGLTFAEASEYIEKTYGEGGSKIDADTKMEALSALRVGQTALHKEKNPEQNAQQFEYGTDQPLTVEQDTSKIEKLNKAKAGVAGVGSALTAAGGIMAATGVGLIPGAIVGGIGALTQAIGGGIINNKISKETSKLETEAANKAANMEIDRSAKANPVSFQENKVYEMGTPSPLIPNNKYGENSLYNVKGVTGIGEQRDATLDPAIYAQTDKYVKSMPKDSMRIPQEELQPMDTDLDTSGFENSFKYEFGTPGAINQYGSNNNNATILNNNYTDAINAANDLITKPGLQLMDASPIDYRIEGDAFDKINRKADRRAARQTSGGFGAELSKGEKIGLGTQLGASVLGNTLAMILAKKSKEIVAPRVKEDRQAREFKLDETIRTLQNQEASNREALLQRSGGDFGQYAQAVSGLHTGTGKAIGATYAQGQQMNQQEQQFTDQFNQRGQQINARYDVITENMNAQNEAAYNDQMTAYEQAMFANLGSVGKSITNIGQGDRELEAYRQLTKSLALIKPTK